MLFVEDFHDFGGVWRGPFEGVVVGDVWVEEDISDGVDFFLGEGDFCVVLEDVFEAAVFFDGGEAFFGSVAFDAVVEVGAEEDGDVDELFAGDVVLL